MQTPAILPNSLPFVTVAGYPDTAYYLQLMTVSRTSCLVNLLHSISQSKRIKLVINLIWSKRFWCWLSM